MMVPRNYYDPRGLPRRLIDKWRARFFKVWDSASGTIQLYWNNGKQYGPIPFVYKGTLAGTVMIPFPDADDVAAGSLALIIEPAISSRTMRPLILMSDGTRWRPIAWSTLFADSGSAGNPVATATGAASGSIYVAGTSVANLHAQPDSHMRFRARVRKSGANGTATYTLRLGGSVICSVAVDAADDSEALLLGEIGVRAANSQVVIGTSYTTAAGGGFKSAAGSVDRTIDLTANQAWDIVYSAANAADTHELLDFITEAN